MYQYNENNYCSPEEIQRIIAAVLHISKHAERNALLIEVGWETGGRISEVLTLVPEHVMEKSIVLVNLKQRKLKSGKPPNKIVEVSPELCAWIRKYCDKNNIQKGDWVFPAERSKVKHLDRSLVFDMITAASESAGVYRMGKDNIRSGSRYKGISYHVLRHSYATHLLRKGNKMAVVQAQLGHSNIGSTQQYASIVIDDVRATVAAARVNLYHPEG